MKRDETAIKGIDVVLKRIPRPDLELSKLTVDALERETDHGKVGYAGAIYGVTVELANRGTKVAGGEVVVFSRTASDKKEILVGRFSVAGLTPGGEMTNTITWTGGGSLGDVTITALACDLEDRIQSNDLKSEERYVIIDDNGSGVYPDPRLQGGQDWCTRDYT